VRRVAVVYDPQIGANVAFLNVVQQMSLAQGVTVSAARVHDGGEMEPALMSFGKEPNGGLIVAPNPINSVKRDVLIGLAAKLRLPAVYPFRFYPDSGGLASYGFDRMQQVREAATYVDRILRGAKPGDLPVQLPTKFEFVINLKTAKALGLTIPQSLLVRADEVLQ
jgi:putative ABC transport system substrate-binding protein